MLEYVKEKRSVSDEYLKFVDEIDYFSYKDITEAKIHFVKSDVESIDINDDLIKSQ